jgi:hypothetical protein
MSQNPQGRLDVLIFRLADELGNRVLASTRIDIRESLKETADALIDDMGIPRSTIDALLKLPNRKFAGRQRVSRPRATPGKSGQPTLRRVV